MAIASECCLDDLTFSNSSRHLLSPVVHNSADAENQTVRAPS